MKSSSSLASTVRPDRGEVSAPWGPARDSLPSQQGGNGTYSCRIRSASLPAARQRSRPLPSWRTRWRRWRCHWRRRAPLTCSQGTAHRTGSTGPGPPWSPTDTFSHRRTGCLHRTLLLGYNTPVIRTQAPPLLLSPFVYSPTKKYKHVTAILHSGGSLSSHAKVPEK